MSLADSLQVVGGSMVVGVLLGCGAAYVTVYAGPLGVAGTGMIGGLALMITGAVLGRRQRRAANGGGMK
jgi:hypothetical protein